jgi:acyl carrier protein
MDREEFRKIVAQILEIPPESIREDTDFYNDLGVDSLKLLKLINGIECHYNIDVDDGQLDSLSNFGDAYAYVAVLTRRRLT